MDKEHDRTTFGCGAKVIDSHMDSTNPYRSPESLDVLPGSPGWTAAFRIGSRIMLAVTLLLTMLATYQIFRSRDGYSRIFSDFGALPPLTRVVLSHGYSWILPALGVIGIAKEFLLKNARVTLAWNGVHLAVAIVVWRLYVVGVFGNFADLIKRLGG
ncbi:MAG: hypothetical protein ABFD16_31685 [Thermoguttaceae bacterium]|jgi:hypothetical protein